MVMRLSWDGLGLGLGMFHSPGLGWLHMFDSHTVSVRLMICMPIR